MAEIQQCSLERCRQFLFATLALIAVVLWSAPSAKAAEITVTTERDEVTSNGACSLREAILAANEDIAVDSCAAGDGTDKILLSAGVYLLEIAGIGDDRNLTGDLDVSNDLIILGRDGAESTALDAQQIDRALHIGAGVRVVVSGLTISNGFVGGSNGLGGGLLADSGAVSLTDMRFVNNSAGRGGAIYVNNSLTLRNSSFVDNTAGEGGAIFHATRGKAQIVNTLFANNQAQKGAVYCLGADALAQTDIVHTTIASDDLQTGNAIDINSGSVAIVNSIITSYATGIQVNSGKVQSHHNLFFDVTTVMAGKGTMIDNGYNIVGKDPAFVDAANDDYRLLESSAAMHQGKAIGVLTDFFGAPRPRNSSVDLGFAQGQSTALALNHTTTR